MPIPNVTQTHPTIGLALGSGSARGWAHIGVIHELAEHGIVPQVVCGSSIGALVGAMFVSGHLDTLEQWVTHLNRKDIIGYLDIKLLVGGGFIEGRRLIDFLHTQIGAPLIEELETPFAAVATNLMTGEEQWLRSGSLLEAVRASIALPGLFTPARDDDRWLVDGGLVNPVPISLCRALGAERIIAVNLNGNIVGKHLARSKPATQLPSKSTEAGLLENLALEIRQRTGQMMSQWFDNNTPQPGLLDVVATSIHIMQDRITRSRMAGDPPDVLISPRLNHIGLLEFDRASECIEAGRKAVRLMLPGLQDILAQ